MYLGAEESHNKEHRDEKEDVKKEYVRKLRLILNKELSAKKNEMQAVGTLATSALSYRVGITNWHHEDIQKLDRKTRKMLTIHGQHHPTADTDRLHFPRKEAGRGMMQWEGAYTTEVKIDGTS
jgi:hypothetical protein